MPNYVGELPWLIDAVTGRPIGIKTRFEELGILTQDASGKLWANGAEVTVGSGSSQLYLSGISMPISGTPTIGVTATTFCGQAWSKRAFTGVRMWAENYLETSSSISLAKVAAADTANKDATTLSWNQCTLKGAATLSVPAGLPQSVGSQTVNDIPSRAGYDPTGLVAIPRVDGGQGFLCQYRALTSSGFVGRVTTSAADMVAYNAATGESWLGLTVAGDHVTTIDGMSLGGIRWLTPMLEFLYPVPVCRVLIVGDSLSVGAESTGNTWGPVKRACDALDSSSKYVIPELMGISGQGANYSRNTLLARLLVGPRPNIVCRNVWSPNTALSSDTIMAAIQGYIAAEISACHELGIKYVIGTSGPVDNQTAAEITRRDTLNAWARSLYAAGVVDGLADWQPLVEDPANHGKRLPAYVGSGGTQSHYNDAGYAAESSAWVYAMAQLV